MLVAVDRQVRWSWGEVLADILEADHRLPASGTMYGSDAILGREVF
jgi:hypothetical protein